MQKMLIKLTAQAVNYILCSHLFSVSVIFLSKFVVIQKHRAEEVIMVDIYIG